MLFMIYRRLFNGVFSTVRVTLHSMVDRFMNDELEGKQKEELLAVLMHHPSIFVERLRKTTKNLRKHSQSPARVSIQRPFEDKVGTQPLDRDVQCFVSVSVTLQEFI
jgi:hypothetical protein